MRRGVLGCLAGLTLLVGCGPRQDAVTDISPGVLGLRITGASLAAATERALTEATAHCAAQGRQTQVLGTDMGRSEYQLAFRCHGRVGEGLATPGAPVPAGPQPMVLLQPGVAPVLDGDPFGRGRTARAAPRPAVTPPATVPTPAVQAAALPPVAAPAARVAAPAADLSLPPGRLFALPARPPILPALAGNAALPPVARPPVAGTPVAETVVPPLR